jgi:hypothetical protein
VPALRGDATKLYLPFVDDDRLAVILSKAHMLVADDRIAGPSTARRSPPRMIGAWNHSSPLTRSPASA